MSRVTIKTEDPKVVLHVGLDGPMQCYFGHAYRLTSADDDPNDPPNEAFNSEWSTDNYGLCAWMRRHNAAIKDDEFTRKVFDLIQGDLDPGEAAS